MPATPRALRHALRLVVPSLAAILVSSSGCKSSNGSGGGVPATGRCEIDLAPFRGSGAGALARQISDPSDLMQGDSATGRVGDYLLANERVRVIVQGPDRHIQPNPFGGAIVDADVVRPPGEESSDQFGKLGLFYNFGRTTNVEKVEVLEAGGNGAAIVAATGRDDLNDYLNIRSILPLPTSVKADTAVNLLETTYYVLAPGERRVHLVTAFCNQSSQAQSLAVGDLIDSGGDVEFFNPKSPTGGFGYVGGLAGLSELPFFAFWGSKTAYAYVPPVGRPSSQITESGVVGILAGSTLDRWLGASPPPAPDSLVVPANGKATFERDFVVGGDLAAVTDLVYALRGATVRLSGTVRSGGAPLAGARVAVVDAATQAPVAVAQTGADGTWGLAVPHGSYQAAADLRWTSRSAFRAVDVSAPGSGDQAGLDFTLEAPVTVTVALHDPAGAPIPGKVVVYCVDAAGKELTCPFPRGDAHQVGNLFRSSSYDPWGDTVQAVVFVDHRGSADVELPAAHAYAFVASRGPEWSVWPDTWPTSLGAPVTPAAGQTVDMELAHVVDTTGWISGDFHVHGVNSPDSPVTYLDRLRTFLAEGVDVLVATDHDYVTDYTPYLRQLDDLPAPARARKASAWLRTIVGEELTTFDYGHWNAFPLERQVGDLTGGAVDWAGGTGPSLTPKQIHDALRAMPGAVDRVVQANHPRGNLGWFSHVRLDTGDGATHACPSQFRIPGVPGCDEAKGSAQDTGLFDDGFTAMEIVNDFEEQRIHGRINDWFTFLSRGLLATATSVSDTHHRVLVSAGYGRSYVRLGTDDPATLDPAALARAVNARQVVASVGAFATLTARNGAGQVVGVGDLIPATGDHTLTIHAHVETPAWLPPWQVELHGYSPARSTRYEADGSAQDDYGNTSWPGYCATSARTCNAPAGDEAAAFAAQGVLAARGGAQLVDGADPTNHHQRWVWDQEWTVTPPQDTWYVLVVRRDPGASPAFAGMAAPLAPAVSATNGGGPAALSILAVTNPILVDVDGNGRYDPPAVRTPRQTPWPLRANAPIDYQEALRRSARISAEK